MNINMKSQVLTVVSTIMLFVPWTVYCLRNFEWALESPVAEIMIVCCTIFMIFSYIFTVFFFFKLNIQNWLMKICLIVTGIYAVIGVILLGMFINSQIIK